MKRDLSASLARFTSWMAKYVEGARGAVVSVRPGRAAEGAGIPLGHAALFLYNLYRMGLAERFNRSVYTFRREGVAEALKALEEVVANMQRSKKEAAGVRPAIYVWTTAVKMPVDMIIELETYAKSNGITRSEAIRRALRDYLDLLMPEDVKRHKAPRKKSGVEHRTVSFDLDDALLNKLERRAAELGGNKSDVVRAAVAKMLGEDAAEEEPSVAEAEMPVLVGRT